MKKCPACWKCSRERFPPRKRLKRDREYKGDQEEHKGAEGIKRGPWHVMTQIFTM